MARLFAFTCNDPVRMKTALVDLRAVLTADEAAHGYGVASYQGGEVLLQRQPKPQAPVDFVEVLKPVVAEVVVGNLASPGAPPATENTPPFRYRSWVFGASGKLTDVAATAQALAEAAPAFLARHQRGVSTGERLFAALLAQLHAVGALDDAEPTMAHAALAIRRLVRAIDAAQAERGEPAYTGALVLTNGRFLLAARLGAPVGWLRVRTDRAPAKPRPEAQNELRYAVVVAEPRNLEGLEAVPPRSIVTITRDFATAVEPLDA